MDHEVLHRLLDEVGRYDPEYGAGLSNHLPMAWLALARLGAGEARLREFGATYVGEKGLRPARQRAPWPVGEAWTGRLGRRAAWPIYLDLFERWVSREGVERMLPQVLPAMMPGVGAAAFHGLIRTAAGVQAGHAAEVAQGLAHWAAWHLPLGPMPRTPEDTGPESDPAVLLRLLRRLPAGARVSGLIAERMKAAAARGEVNPVAARLLIDDGTPQRLARAAAFAYAETGNFTALHLVTGTHAMRMIARFFDDGPGRLAAWRWFWQAYAHGVVAARLSPTAVPLRVADWPAALAVALAAHDEHVIKLVDAAREEENFYGGNDWCRAASRAVMETT